MKCEYCINLKHRYMVLTGMHYPELQKAIDKGELKWTDFTCEGMGCKYFARGTEMGLDMRDAKWDCPHFKLKIEHMKERLAIDSHANRNKYPEPLNLTIENGKMQEKKA